MPHGSVLAPLSALSDAALSAPALSEAALSAAALSADAASVLPGGEAAVVAGSVGSAANAKALMLMHKAANKTFVGLISISLVCINGSFRDNFGEVNDAGNDIS